MIDRYKTEETICGKIDCVTHANLIDALDWQRNGIDVVLYRMDGDVWKRSQETKLELMDY